VTGDGLLTATIRRWRADARVYVRECLGATPDAWQDDVLGLLSNPTTRRLAMKACKGPGKTAVLAWVILWFLTCHVEAKVGCTSITEANIDTNLWPEISKWMSRSAYVSAAFEWTKSAVTRRDNPNWFAVKRTWPKSGDIQQQADALAGIHADNVMFVLDESGGIPQAVMVTAEAVLSNEIKPGCRALVVQSGNPTHTTGPLHRACTVDRALWQVVTVTGDPDSPLAAVGTRADRVLRSG
jgi:phage terminase large subunit